ncbi:MAG TPA: TetR family transcriptional regulator [Marmoricola sp.]|nr:TetR family transcriptional regulator [Marmoricola sp.]
MGRWEPDAAGRLRTAALELHVERGFEQTTVAEIAERAGVTARTFFRYFSDKREVLFGGSEHLQAAMVAAVESAPAASAPLDVVAAALTAAAEMIGGNRAYAEQRWSVISANADLRERELMKMESLAAALADALRGRGVPDPRAGLAAEAGIAVFRVGFERWVSGPTAELADVLAAALADLRVLAAG